MNENYFEKLDTPEKYYWYGFLFLKWLYENNTFCLNRKYEKYLDMEKYFLTPRKGTSKFRCVWLMPNGKFEANFVYKKIKYRCGVFESETAAAMAYNKKATEIMGDKAILNTIF